MLRLIATLLLAGTLAACASHNAGTTALASSATPASATTNALAGTPMATYGHALNKAKNVQDIVNQQAKKQAKAIDDATAGH
ncbi:MAG TPA: hypothetical protein VFW60_05295 [Rhodanobacteraceae bacterium]|nr:hypothetical protein [Rhodanobacteraceae bacterium]